MHEASARELVRRGEAPSALHNNCSGKHAGLLLACRLLGLAHARATPTRPSPPAADRDAVARYAAVPEARITVAVDGCNAPVFRLPLVGASPVFARSWPDAVGGGSRGRRGARPHRPRDDEAARHGGGSGRFTSDFLTAGRGRWIGKEGAEGVYAVGVSVSPRSGGKAVGVALKIEDGSCAPATPSRWLSWSGSASSAAGSSRPRDVRRPVVRNVRGHASARSRRTDPASGELGR